MADGAEGFDQGLALPAAAPGWCCGGSSSSSNHGPWRGSWSFPWVMQGPTTHSSQPSALPIGCCGPVALGVQQGVLSVPSVNMMIYVAWWPGALYLLLRISAFCTGCWLPMGSTMAVPMTAWGVVPGLLPSSALFVDPNVFLCPAWHP